MVLMMEWRFNATNVFIIPIQRRKKKLFGLLRVNISVVFFLLHLSFLGLHSIEERKEKKNYFPRNLSKTNYTLNVTIYKVKSKTHIYTVFGFDAIASAMCRMITFIFSHSILCIIRTQKFHISI